MIGYYSDMGNFRKINEDYISYYVGRYVKIYVIADGMGGHNAGEVASQIAVEKVIEYIKNNEIKDIELEKILKEAIEYSNGCVYDLALKNNNLSGMGTTITAYITDGKRNIVANVGDSSCYGILNDKIQKITKDHSLVQQLLDEGTITKEQAKNHPNKNIITRALGIKLDLQIDLFEVEKLDIVILCTDGLTNEVSVQEIYNYINEADDNMKACRNLIELVKSREGRDNISVMIFEGGDY
jgi:protein phosphatase